jgi:hypothetical protein
MSDETEQIRDDMGQELRFARTDWLTLAGDVSLKLLEQAIEIGATLGEVSWDEAVVAYESAAVALIKTRMADRPPVDAAAHTAFLASLHINRHNPNCVCRTASCGHLASDHVGANGACLICEKECWL